MSEEEPTARELIEAIRGGVPGKCDFCGKITPPEYLDPEEAGEWVCWKCSNEWDKKELAKVAERRGEERGWEARGATETYNGNDPFGERAEREKDYPQHMKSIGYSRATRQKWKTLSDWRNSEEYREGK